MKKSLKILGYALGVVVLLLLAGATFVYFRGIPNYPNDAQISAHGR